MKAALYALGGFCCGTAVHMGLPGIAIIIFAGMIAATVWEICQ